MCCAQGVVGEREYERAGERAGERVGERTGDLRMQATEMVLAHVGSRDREGPGCCAPRTLHATVAAGGWTAGLLHTCNRYVQREQLFQPPVPLAMSGNCGSGHSHNRNLRGLREEQSGTRRVGIVDLE